MENNSKPFLANTTYAAKFYDTNFLAPYYEKAPVYPVY
jgi:hypothetical protein